jgi:hypothetical protein
MNLKKDSREKSVTTTTNFVFPRYVTRDPALFVSKKNSSGTFLFSADINTLDVIVM